MEENNSTISTLTTTNEIDKQNYWEGDVFIYKGGVVNVDDKQKIRHVQVHESVSKIDDRAFYTCFNLSKIDIISKNMKCIGNRSFYKCTKLKNIDWKETEIEIIDCGAFFGCSRLTTICFPSTLKQLCHGAFFHCSSLASVNLQETCIVSIGNRAFGWCTSLTEVTLPDTIKLIQEGTFEQCTGLTSINLQTTSIESIGNVAFRGCTNLITINLCPSTTTASTNDATGSNILLNKPNLLPPPLKEFRKLVFDECPKLANIIDTNSVHFHCDLNRGGFRRFLCRNDHGNHDKGNHQVHYFSSLWPLILHRIMNKIEFPKTTIRSDEVNLTSYTNEDSIRRASVVYCMMIHGVAMHY